MSHELRTPLNSLLILAKMLAANETGNLTAEQVEEAEVIHNGGLELLGLINDILDLSKVEAGKLTLTLEDVTLESIAARLQQQFAPVAREKGVAFPLRVEAGLPATLHTDTQRVEQILKNLLSNAFKFTAAGSVTLQVHRPSAGQLPQGAGAAGSIAFSVTDTGIGIAASKLKDIFEAFQQENGSIDRHYGGTGLGLTIARKFAQMLGGEIHVASVKGQGSTFTLVLPAALAAEAGGEASRQVTLPAATENAALPLQAAAKIALPEFIADDRNSLTGNDKLLLVIEDDPTFAATLMKLARKRGYKCLAAGDGKSGLLLAAEQPVTAVILDLQLPDIDGMAVLDQLKGNLKTRHIPVHIISGRADATGAAPLRKGAIGSLAKPAEKDAIDAVFAKIERLLQAKVKHVLAVEDDKKNQLAIQNLLKRTEVEITLAGTGKAALAALKKQPFDCIILDLQLPDMTGFQWLETAEADLGGGNLPPVVVYTARDLSEDENRHLNRYTGSIIIKGAKSPERLLDEVTLFLHSVESTLSADQQQIIRMQHNPDKVLAGRTVLLTDDDLRNTFALSRLLKAHGVNIVIADNGRMALDKLKEDKSIELVIMDIMMPVMDGYQAMREIRAQKAHQNLPIIALTARAMPDEREKCIAAGANDYLTKPVDIEQLLTLLRVCLFRQELAA
jgi:CheY-like chemotaxis protein